MGAFLTVVVRAACGSDGWIRSEDDCLATWLMKSPSSSLLKYELFWEP